MFNPTFYPLYENSGITLIGDRIKLKSLLILERSPSQVSPYTFFFPASPGSDNQALFWSGTETTFRGIAIADVATLQTSLSAINTTLNSLGTAAFQNSGFFAVANHIHSIATQSLAGFLSNADKIIIDNLSTAYAPLSHSHTGTPNDNFIINSDAANTGSDRSITLARPASQSASYSLILPTNLGTANQGLIISSISGSSANLSWGNSGGGFSGVTSHSTASVNINLVNGNMVAIALNQHTTIASITGVPIGQGAEFTIIATQDATGNRTLSFPGGTTITGAISTQANSTSVIKLFSFNAGASWEAIVIKPLPNTVSATVWIPSQIAPGLWLDVSDGSTIAIGSGVSQVNDKSGNNRHATQNSASKQPALISNALNSKNALRFDGIDDGLNFNGSFLAGNNYLITIVVARRSSKSANHFIAGTNQATNGLLHLGWRTDTIVTLGQFYNDYDISVASYSIPEYDIWCFTHNNSTGKAIYKNGTLVGSNTNTTGLSSYNSATIGDYPGSSFNGDVCEIVMVSGANANDTNRQLLEGYYASSNRWNLQSNLPSGHPYKSSPPTI